MSSSLLESGYQIKTRWVGDGFASLWRWSHFFTALSDAKKYKSEHQGETESSYNSKLEIEIFCVERLDYTGDAEAQEDGTE